MEFSPLVRVHSWGVKLKKKKQSSCEGGKEAAELVEEHFIKQPAR